MPDNGDNPLPIQPDDNSWLSAPTDASGRPVITVTPRSNAQNNMVDPTIGADYGTYDDPLIQSVKDAADKLFGLEGQTRYQTWPERLVRSAIMAPGDALAGQIQPNSDQEIGRAMDMASLGGVGPLAEPATAEMTLGSGMTRMPLNGGEMADAPVFYSAVENAVNGAKIDNAPVSQWLGYLKNQPGVKQEELDYTLGELPPDQKMSKQDMQDYVDANKVQLNEVNKGNTNPNYLAMNQDQLADMYENQGWSRPEAEELAERDYVPADNPTKFESYQLPGGSNYKEMLMQLPTDSESLNVKPSIEEPGRFDVVDRTGRVRYTGDEIDAQNYKSDEIDRGLDSQTDFQSSHWDEPNVLAHVRMNDRNVDGLKTLNLEEIQSDWHQQGRQRGYQLTPQQKTNFDAIDQKIVDSGDDDVMGDPDIKSAIGKAIDKKILTPEEGRTYLQNYRGADAQNPVPNAPFKQTWPDLALKRMIRYAADNGYDALSWTPGEAQALRYQNEIRQKINNVEWHNKSMGKVDPTGNKKILVEPSHGSEIELSVDKNGQIVGGHPQLKGKRLDAVLGKDIASKILEKDEGNVDAKNYVMNSEPMKAFYDKMLVDKANAIAKKYGGKVEYTRIAVPHKNGVQGQVYDNVPFLKLPQSLKDTAQQKGFPLFSSGVMLQPVIGNPFKDKQWLKPVDYNPFTDS